MLFEYFSTGTKNTVTGTSIGVEIETYFVDKITGVPISVATSHALLTATGAPARCRVKLELGRQKIELAIGPCRTFRQLLSLAHESLAWLYQVAASRGAIPRFEPEIAWDGSLLDISTDPRDQLWMKLDGRSALEELCRCSSVQFTVAVNPGDAIPTINAFWVAQVHELDYVPNNQRWQQYIARSHANYLPDRYAGPAGFESLADYIHQLERHNVVMHNGQIVRQQPSMTTGLDIGLFLRSIWWHYRLRRYGSTLALEIRPLARRDDDCLKQHWEQIAPIIGL